MSTILNQIQETRNHFIDTLDRMLANGSPVVLCGTGFVAQLTWEFMQREGMRVDYVAVGGEYLRPDTEFNGMPVVSFESLAARDADYNYIMAIQFTHDALIHQLQQNAREILFYDCMFIGINATEYFTVEWCEKHQQELDALYHRLSDDKSRETLVAFINQRICAKEGRWKTVYEDNQYFPDDLIALTADEVFVDCGAFTGDSIGAFLGALKRQNAGAPAKIYAFEPDRHNFAQLQQNTAALPQCECLNAGVWYEETTLRFNASSAQTSAITDDPDGDEIKLMTIDDVTRTERVTFLKMDIEGAEMAALKGARETIKKHQPLLAISIYHKPEDLVTIPAFILSLHADYQFWLRAHHPRLACDMVLYAIPPARVKPTA